MNLAQRAKIIDGSQKYKFYNYLQGDGTAYINTGLVPTANMKAEILFNSPASSAVFGSRTSSSSYDKFLIILGAKSVIYGAYAHEDGLFASDYTNVLTKCELSQNGFYINGSLKVAFSSEFSEGDKSMYIFARNDGGAVGFCNTSKIYYLKFWDNDILIRNFVPAKRRSDGMLGMLDKVHNVFYTNAAGSGSFTIG